MQLIFLYIGLCTGESERELFLTSIGALPGLTHTVRRSYILEDVLSLYGNENICQEYPIDIEFESEEAIDHGGVQREMFSAFWEQAYLQLFEGATILTPLIHPQTDTTVFPVLGRILSHGYLVTGFLPIRIALPTLICMLLGPGRLIPSDIVEGAFLDYLCCVERETIKEAFGHQVFTHEMQSMLLNTLSRYGCRQVPTPSNLQQLLQQIAKYELCVKPTAAVAAIHSGIPSIHSPFWNNLTVQDVQSLYKSLTVTASRVLGILQFPDTTNAAEERILGYLSSMVGNMNEVQLQNFLRFVTGSSVVLGKAIHVQFNGLSGLARRPIAHTCDCLLELPVAYSNFQDFFSEWLAVLSDTGNCWTMNSL